jgi:biopolymer transport protein ExbD
LRRTLFRHRPEPAGVGLDVGALAPMVDMMVLLLVFLLRTYSTDLAPAPEHESFELAGTTSDADRSGGVELLVSTEAVYVNGHRVAAWEFIEGSGVIDPLYAVLLQVRPKVRAEVHADAGVPWRRLERVLQTAQAAGVEEIALVGVWRGGM